ncbi:MAG: SDR family oxidoreductase [Methylococcaceae bacterium]|nr:SDR family oxidoreductase [Methylococcaceae bacterium]
MLADKTILITGASGGIGSEVAKRLSEEGAILVLVGRDEVSLGKLNEMLGSNHHIIQADISHAADRNSIMEYCQNLDGGIDILINNAGIGQFSLFRDMGEDEVTSIITTNLTSTVLLTQCLLPTLLSRPEPQIVNVGSILGSIGLPGSTIYCASKFGLRGFSEALRRELLDTSLAVRYFAPRATKTAINNDRVTALNGELGTKMDTVESVADALISFLKSSTTSQYLGWPEKIFVKINSVLPGVVEKSIAKQLIIFKRYLSKGL